MVSEETGLPTHFDIRTGENVRWSVELGSPCYSSPIVAKGRVLIGTNNTAPMDPRFEGIRGVLLCLDEATGKLQWQLVVPKFETDRYLDWHLGGICSPPTVEGDRVYVVTNRAEVLCLDLDGLADGNDGPFQNEGAFMAKQSEPPFELTDHDADIIWRFDMTREVHVHFHDAAHSAILIRGSHLYLNTGNGVDKRHSGIPEPDAPSLIVLDKETGRLIGQDGERIGPRIFHCTWSPPALAQFGNKEVIVFCGGDGVVYGFRPLPLAGQYDQPQTLQRLWRFDCDPEAPKENVHQYIRNSLVSPSNIKSTPVALGNRVYVTYGGDIWWGKREAWLACIDINGEGDLTRRARLWTYTLQRHCCATPSVWDGMVFVGDLGRTLHCVDAQTGEPIWKLDTKGEIWASALVADGKVYVGNKRGEFFILSASRRKEVIAQIDMDAAIWATAVAANKTLFVTTQEKLYAIR